MTRLVRAVIDTAALRDNLAVVRRLAPRSKVMAVVKANAYGHGLVPAAAALPDVDAFGVARIEEGLALHSAGVRNPIVLLEGVFDTEQLAEAAARGFELMVHAPEQLALLKEWRGAHRFPVWLKIDTGINRLGFRPEQFRGAYAALTANTQAVGQIRLLTHLANADDPSDPVTAGQLRLFKQTTAGLTLERSIANSAGVIGWPDTHAEWIRPGLMLYGASPLKARSAADHGLKPVMTLLSTVIAVKRIPAGEKVGYGGCWTARRDTHLAIVAVGYGDGYPRNLDSGTPVLINGKQACLAGRVSMDMIGVDVADLPQVKTGDPVILWGEGLPVESVAPHADTIPYELLCGLSQRVALELK